MPLQSCFLRRMFCFVVTPSRVCRWWLSLLCPQASLFGDPPKYRVVVSDIEYFTRVAAQGALPPQIATLLEKMSARVRRGQY